MEFGDDHLGYSDTDAPSALGGFRGACGGVASIAEPLDDCVALGYMNHQPAAKTKTAMNP
jgi:hypothetical protein